MEDGPHLRLFHFSSIPVPSPLALFFSPYFSCVMSSKPAQLLRDQQLQKPAQADFKSAETFSRSNEKVPVYTMAPVYTSLGLCWPHCVLGQCFSARTDSP